MRQTSSGVFALLTDFEDRVDHQRAVGLTAIGFALFMLSMAWLAAAVATALSTPDAPMAGMLRLPATYAAPVLSLAVWWASRRGFLGTGATLFVVLLGVIALTAMNGTMSFSTVILLTMPMAAAGSLMRRPGISATAAALVAAVVVLAIVQRQNTAALLVDPSATVLTDFAVTLVTLLVDAGLLVAFAGWAPSVASDAQRDVIALQRVAAFGAALDIDNEDMLLTQALAFVRNEMKFTFAQFFLIGQTGVLEERVRLAVGGKGKLERATIIGLQETGAVWESAQARRSIRVDRSDLVSRRTHFLPTSITGALLPLIYNDTLVGLLDVQHEAIPSIPDYQMLALQTLADNVAATLSTVRQSVALRTTVRQQDETAQALRARLAELTAGGRRSQRAGQRMVGYDVATDGTLVPANDLPATLRPALESAELQVEQAGKDRIVRVPIMLRNETLGLMSFTVPNDKPLNERQLDTAKALAGRLALALENKRLIEQTRMQAERERIASDVANTLISATNVDSVLSVAVESFREVLGAVNSRIHVQPYQTAGGGTQAAQASAGAPASLPASEPVAGD